jgi:adenine-specific DNA-methyltransferase
MPEIQLKKALNNAFIKIRPERTAIDNFKANLIKLIDGINKNPTETEEFYKNLISDFLKITWYAPDYFINTSKNIDMVIHDGDSSKPIAVMIEAKSHRNKNEMVTCNNLNAKAMQELLLYYLRETNESENIRVKHLIITNAVEWFIFDAGEFYKYFSCNKTLMDLFKDFKSKSLLGKDTDTFYNLIASPYIEKIKNEIEFTYINLSEYENFARSAVTEDDLKLINLYKILSPNHLLKKSITNDSNTLNNNFYLELLYIMGLSEKKEDYKLLIGRNEDGKQQSASLIENALFQLSDTTSYDDIKYYQSFDLIITWINRILFLKLLEAQLLKYQNGNKDYSFLNTNTIKTFNELNILFFNVLAVEPVKRADKVKDKFKNIPYLNSSLFEKTETEKDTILISNLGNEEIDIFHSTVLIDNTGNKRKGKIKILDYIFEFLDAFDFSSEVTEQIQERHKTLISASVLGLIFEKINGYKDGSFFTPGFITSYICSETIKKIVIDKFNSKKKWNIKNFIDLFNNIHSKGSIEEANNIINSLKLLDPAVGSGHFLVSALNEIIAIKSELGVLVDTTGKRILGEIKVFNDELIIFDESGDYFEYKYKIKESQRIQEAIFTEKRRIIENCLFGVDINLNSAKICRLRLWVELLKHSYYRKETGFSELETLPNIDINIKSGDSLLSRFNIKETILFSLLDHTFQEYQEAVEKYKSSNDKSETKKLLEKIKTIKTYFISNMEKHNSLYIEKENLENKLGDLLKDNIEFEFITDKQKEEKNKKFEKITNEINIKQMEIDEFLHGKIYENAFEWRLEFPEILDKNGSFIGFDAVIGNPPYLREGRISKTLFEKYKSSPYYQGKMDIWYLFACLGINLLKQNGILTFIATNNWTTAAGAGKLRNAIVQDTKILKLIDFTSFMVFDNASIQTMIMSFMKDTETDNYNIDYRKLTGDVSLLDALDLLSKKPNNNTEYLSPLLYRNNFVDKYLTFSSSDIILNKIAEKRIYLTEKEVANGIHPHYDFINKKLATLHNLKIGTGIFGLSKTEKNNLKLSKEELKLIKPYYTTDQIHRYYSAPKNNLFIIYTTSKYKKPDSMNKYPNLKKHLDKYKKVITSDNRPYGLHRSREERFFKGEKIFVYRKCVGKPSFSYSDFTCYVSATFYVIKTSRINTKYLLGLLNSKLIAFWLRNRGKMQGNNYQLDKEPLMQIPIFNPTEVQQKPIISYVDKILVAKKENSKADTSGLEQKIDSLVYKLYELSDDDISVIEKV